MVACIFVASPALADTVETTSAETNGAAVNLNEIDETGFSADLEKGHFEKRDDGSVAIVDESNEDVAVFGTSVNGSKEFRKIRPV